MQSRSRALSFADRSNRSTQVYLAGWLILAALAALPASPAFGKGPRYHHQDRPEASPILAHYDFEASTPSGPDTFWVREARGGEVALSRAFRISGERSLHISEVPGNRDFAEFLAYFQEAREGSVFIQFYLLLTDPDQHFNFGLAGTEWFLSTEPHGQAIWLQTDEGRLRHRTAAGWRDLFAPQPFAWYFVDLVYHVDRGVYDLSIFEENLSDPVVRLHNTRAMHGQEKSSVRYFSLIGDLEDAGRFDFFVDDLVIATDPEVLQSPFVAPGRRQFFVDSLAVGSAARSERSQERLLRWARGTAADAEVATMTDEVLDRLEAAGEAAFREGDLKLARSIFERLRQAPDRAGRAILKLADVVHLLGEYESERGLRESLYGHLELEEYK